MPEERTGSLGSVKRDRVRIRAGTASKIKGLGINLNNNKSAFCNSIQVT